MKKKKLNSSVSFDLVKSVSMQTLDKELSKHVEIARTKPVPIDRYGVPWVWIVSHPLWMEVDYLKSFVPENHALVALREAIDSILAYEGLFMNELSMQCESGMDARMITRAWLLQIVYSLANPKRVREELGYNMLWRWFVGYLLRSEPLPELRAFVQDINMASAHPHVVDIVHRCLSNGALLSADTEEFNINRGLLHALRAHHLDVLGLAKSDPSARVQREHDEQIVTE
jgi:transposase